jgi:hypothetical protein
VATLLGGLALAAWPQLRGRAATATTADPLRGTWTAERARWHVEGGGTATLVELMLRQTRSTGSSSHSLTLPLEELAGLTPAQLDAAAADARFTWTRDAGRFTLEGRFEAGSGAGHFTFTPSTEYVADMRRRGYSEVDDAKALSLAFLDVSRGFVDELTALGYRAVPLDTLVSLRIHGASPEFIRAVAALGQRELPLDKIVAFRIHGVSPDFIHALRDLGYTSLAADELVSFRIHGVSPAFVKEIKALGYEPRPDELVSLRIHGVSADFARRAQDRRGKSVSLDTLVSMRIHGQEPD